MKPPVGQIPAEIKKNCNRLETRGKKGQQKIFHVGRRAERSRGSVPEALPEPRHCVRGLLVIFILFLQISGWTASKPLPGNRIVIFFLFFVLFFFFFSPIRALFFFFFFFSFPDVPGLAHSSL
jgi:hypothetical protein